jgi:hypothetical protein
MKTFYLIQYFILCATMLNAQKVVENNVALIANLKKMSLCTFELQAGSGTAAVGGIIGAAYDVKKNANDRPYYEILQAELVSTIEEMFKSTNIIEYIASEKLTNNQAEKTISLDVMAKDNGLFSCLSARSALGVSIGWKKKVNMTTFWELMTSTGYKIKIKTYSVSKEAQGMFPDVGDPNLKSVWLDLQKENTNQFLDELSKKMKTDKDLQ